jgi:hypothetical membrane protein
MSFIQILAICGMISPIVYTAMWIVGGILESDYSHIRNDISSLFAVNAPNQRLYQTFIIISSVLLFIFFIGLDEGLNDGSSDIFGPLILVIASLLGVLVAFFFPLDEGGELTTYKGKMHLTLVVSMGILTIGGMLAMWNRLQSVAGWSEFAFYSLLSAIVSLIFVIMSLFLASGKYKGISERIMVTPYQLYYFVLGLLVFLKN